VIISLLSSDLMQPTRGITFIEDLKPVERSDTKYHEGTRGIA